jgi:16S rRNA processing protein RimM
MILSEKARTIRITLDACREEFAMGRPLRPIQMAVIGAPHGIKGELRVKTFTGDPLALADYGPLYDETGGRYDVVDIRPAKNVVVVRFRQVNDRTAAEALNGTVLYVDRSVLPDDLEEDQFYHADLIDLPVRDEEGHVVGHVSAFHDFGGGDIVEVALASGKTVLVPFNREAVPVVDLENGAVGINRLAAGLEEEPEAGAEEDFDPESRPRGPKDAGGNR